MAHGYFLPRCHVQLYNAMGERAFVAQNDRFSIKDYISCMFQMGRSFYAMIVNFSTENGSFFRRFSLKLHSNVKFAIDTIADSRKGMIIPFQNLFICNKRS